MGIDFYLLQQIEIQKTFDLKLCIKDLFRSDIQSDQPITIFN